MLLNLVGFFYNKNQQIFVAVLLRTLFPRHTGDNVPLRVRHGVNSVQMFKISVNIDWSTLILNYKMRCSAYIFPALETFRLTFLRMRDICKIINVQRKDKAFMV